MPARPAASTAPARDGPQQAYRPLNVKDALTYLDEVKVQFAGHPEVYNQFLDVSLLRCLPFACC